MTRYLARKLVIYLVTFWVAVTIDWAIPRFMPGDPVERLLSRMQAQPSATEALTGYYSQAFGFDVPDLEAVPQLLGRALPRRPRAEHRQLPDAGVGADLGRAALHARAARARGSPELLGREQGRRAGRPAERRSTTRCCRSHTSLTATPQMWLGIVLGWIFATTLAVPPGLRRVRPRHSADVVAGVRPELSPALDPALLGALPRRLRRLGDRDAEHDHLRARGRLLELPRRARSADQARPQVRLPKRLAAADHGPRARTRRGRRRRDRRRDRLLLSRASER